MSAYHIEDLCPSNEQDWEKLNESWVHGSFFHALRWKRVVEQSFGLQARYYLAYEGETPVALCPMFESSLSKWKALISLPVGDIRHLALLTPNEQEVAQLVVNKAISIAKESKLSCIVLVNPDLITNRVIFDNCLNLNRSVHEYPVAKLPFLDLEKHNPTDIWENVFNSKKNQRKYIKRFEQSGFEIVESRLNDDLDKFYEHYCGNLDHIGGRPCDRSHFDILLKEYSKENLRMTLLQKGEEVAGGLIAFLYPSKKTMYLRYMALNRELPSTYHPPYALYWEAVNYAYKHDFRWVCFGSSSADPDVRSHQIKMGFGCDYRQYYGEIIGMNPLFNIAYKSYMWSRGIRDREPSPPTTSSLE